MRKTTLFLVLISLLIFSNSFAQYEQAKPKNVTQLISMACVFNKGIAAKPEITIYIYDHPDVTNALQSFVGQKMGNTKVKEVRSGTGLPAAKPDIVFIGKKDKAQEFIDYCNTNSILCLTIFPDVVNQGASLGVALKDGKAVLLLNPKGVAAQNQNFNPAIMKMAKVSK